MTLVDFLLNIAGLLFWLTWRSRHLDPLAKSAPRSLLGTLRPAEPRTISGWASLVALVLLLVGRAVLYWQLGSAAEWTPRLDLGLISLAFRNHSFKHALLFSALSFLRLAVIFYFWIIFLTLVNYRVAEDPFQKLLRAQLGRISRWPLVLMLLPVIIVTGLWVALNPLLAQLGILERTAGYARLVEQGLLLSGCLLFTLKYPIPFFLLAYALSSYVYLGSHPVWDFIAATGKNLTKPIRKLPLRSRRVDLAPLFLAVLAVVLLHTIPSVLLIRMLAYNHSPWPQ